MAIVGAGPAGAFAAAALKRQRGDVEVDLIERLPTPWGLLRGGVAPDHQEIKRLEDTFDRQTLRRGCRFLGNVEVGTDISHAELMEHYTAVVYATGAQTDKTLGIPGEDLPGSWAATEFVAWYNGHPDYRDREFDLSAKRAVVIGNGNVAADVVRVLTRSATSSGRPTSPTTRSRRCAPARSRRSSCSAAAAPPRRPSRAPSCASWATSPASSCASGDVKLDPESRALARRGGHLHGAQERPAPAGVLRRARRSDGAARRIDLRFLSSPVEIRGDGRVEAIDVGRNEIVRDDVGDAARRAVDDPAETIECGLVLRSVGYRAVPLPDVPFDERYHVLPSERGRVLTPEGDRIPGVYAVGWIKRGPTGILGTNKRDAEETIGCLVEDLKGLAAPANPRREALDALLAQRKPDLVREEGWRAIAPSSSSAAAPRSAHGSSSPPATSCSTPLRRPGHSPRPGCSELTAGLRHGVLEGDPVGGDPDPARVPWRHRDAGGDHCPSQSSAPAGSRAASPS